MKIAVIGGGISGLGAAYALSQRHEVTLFEAEHRLGGHAHTVDINVGGDRVAVDTGFIVYNEHNYPSLTRLFADIGAPTEKSSMTFSVSLDGGAREYSGTLQGLFAGANFFSSRHWRMLSEIVTFYRSAEELIARPGYAELSLGAFLKRSGFSGSLARDHLLPMAAAIWSSTTSQTLAFPARTFVRFFANHGLFSLTSRPQWRTVSGGSREYVERLNSHMRARVFLGANIKRIERLPHGVSVVSGTGQAARFESVVLATHADQALSILGNSASADERRILGAITCQDNDAYLHCDPTLMPRRRAVWSSWNTLTAKGQDESRPVFVSYWMNRLQNLQTKLPIIVSLNPFTPPAADKLFVRYKCRHPQFDANALAAQSSMPRIQGRERVWFCGAWTGYGFHEDGLASGLSVASALGAAPGWARNIAHKSPAAQNSRPITSREAAE